MDYATNLKALTQGSGYFSREFASYEEAPAYVQSKILESVK